VEGKGGRRRSKRGNKFFAGPEGACEPLIFFSGKMFPEKKITTMGRPRRSPFFVRCEPRRACHAIVVLCFIES